MYLLNQVKHNHLYVVPDNCIVTWGWVFGAVSSVRLQVAFSTHASTSKTETNSHERRYDNTDCCFNNRHLSIVTRVFGREHTYYTYILISTLLLLRLLLLSQWWSNHVVETGEEPVLNQHVSTTRCRTDTVWIFSRNINTRCCRQLQHALCLLCWLRASSVVRKVSKRIIAGRKKCVFGQLGGNAWNISLERERLFFFFFFIKKWFVLRYNCGFFGNTNRNIWLRAQKFE